MEHDKLLSLGLCVAVPWIGGLWGASIVRKNRWWSGKLKRPKFSPPAKAFGPIWAFHYTMLGLSSWFVLQEGGFEKQRYALTIYAIHLFFNLVWTPIFFHFKEMVLAIVIMILICTSLVHMLAIFYEISFNAFVILIPYLAWCTFATYVNTSNWYLNRNVYREIAKNGPKDKIK